MSIDCASPPRIVVLGAGPAGAAVARALATLGYVVQVVSDWRRFDAVESLSARVIEGLRHANLHRAASCAIGPCTRTTLWNGALKRLTQSFSSSAARSTGRCATTCAA
ncbi:hypothetical protein [Paraburkholderia sp. SIMBA_027]|uniref:hypothetical protein n=1 Tax=Paraburkholderia sp. SIMBA_027 TaxID=3085770 RepID=UPI00397D4D2A